jgi:hypothetical protein
MHDRPGDGGTDGGPSLAELRRVLAAQAELIESLQQRLDQLERVDRAPAAVSTGVGHGLTSRRSLMTKGALAAAGAVVGTAALGVATASPAAAATAAFDGDPAVSATADPGTGTGVLGTTATGVGVRGETAGYSGIGVSGLASGTGGGGIGVSGQTDGLEGTGVSGMATTTTGLGVGVYGSVASPLGIGIWGDSSSSGGGTAILGVGDPTSGRGLAASGSIGVTADSARTQVYLTGTPAPPLGAGLARTAGELVLDANLDLWGCVASGTPGTWRRITGPTAAGALVALATPVRVYDSRPGLAPTAVGPKTPLTGGTARSIVVSANASGVPVGATAALVSVVAVDPAAGGYLAVYRDGVAWPGTSSLNFSAGQTVAVTTFTALSATPACALYANTALDVVVDVLGYYQ